MNAVKPIMYPILSDSSLMMSIEAYDRAAFSHHSRIPRPMVRAATILRRDSSTEIINVNRLSQKTTSVIQYVEVAETEGKLYCVDGLVSTHCWLKIVTLAKDCHSCNVLLMSTEQGVVLKTMRCITPGEPLLMWFTENVLALLNMPFLTPSNIQGQNRYICHVCNNLFEYPNPLKIHLALDCNRLDRNHLWSVLAKEFMSPRPKLSLTLFPQVPFQFEITTSPRTSSARISPVMISSTGISSARISPVMVAPAAISPPRISPARISPARISPILLETMEQNNVLSISHSMGSSRQTSPTSSSNHASPSSTSTQNISPILSTRVSPVKTTIGAHQSAFKPYIQQSNYVPVPEAPREEAIPIYNVPAPLPQPVPIRQEVHAAQMETIVSNLGRSNRGHLCIYCGKVYSRKYGLKIHIRTHTGYKPLKCKYCSRPFGDPSNLNKHVRLHADSAVDTPYRCDICGKVLVRRRDLERHVRTRHQEPEEQASESSDSLDV